jgi:Fe-S-cluster containining protein
MVAGCEKSKRIRRAELRKVAEIYDWIDQQLASHSDLAGQCNVCSRCCDFDTYDHRLYVTAPELMYLEAGLNVEKLRTMPSGRCPYNIDGKCSVYEYRFTGCRIFCCKGDAEFQSHLTEAVLEKLKSLCTEFEIPYLYRDLASALNGSSAG